MGGRTENGNGANGWRQTLVDVSVRQGPSFVILLLILYGIWSFGTYAMEVAIPAHLEQIQSGYRQIQEQHDKNLERIIRAVETDQQAMRESQALMREAVDDLKAIRKRIDAEP